MKPEVIKTLSKVNVLSICLLAIFWAAETSRRCSLQVMTAGVFNLASSSLNGLKIVRGMDSAKQDLKIWDTSRRLRVQFVHLHLRMTWTLTPLSLSSLLLEFPFPSSDRKSLPCLSVDLGVCEGDTGTNPPFFCELSISPLPETSRFSIH